MSSAALSMACLEVTQLRIFSSQHFLEILHSFEHEVFLPHFHKSTIKQRETLNSFANWGNKIVFSLNSKLEAANEVVSPSLCSQKPSILCQAGSRFKTFLPFWGFSDSSERDENGLVMGVAIKLIITECATVNTIMKCLLKSNIHRLSLKTSDVFYIPFPPHGLKKHFWHNSGSFLFPQHPVGWLQQVASTSLRNQADAEHSLVSKPSTSQWRNQLIHFLKTSR